MKRSDILKELMEREILDKDEYIILADGFEPAFMGISAQKPKRVIYDYWKCLDVIIRRIMQNLTRLLTGLMSS